MNDDAIWTYNTAGPYQVPAGPYQVPLNATATNPSMFVTDDTEVQVLRTQIESLKAVLMSCIVCGADADPIMLCPYCREAVNEVRRVHFQKLYEELMQ